MPSLMSRTQPHSSALALLGKMMNIEVTWEWRRWGSYHPLMKSNTAHARLELSLEVLAVERLAFAGGEKAFAHGGVKTAADRAYQGPHLGLVAALAESDRGVLADRVGMMDHPGGTALPERHVQRSQHQLGTQVSFHCLTGHCAAQPVEHHRQIREAGPGWTSSAGQK